MTALGDVGDTFRDWNDARRRVREAYGVDCPSCRVKEPRRTPTRLLPRQRCRVCGYQDGRPRLTDQQRSAVGDDWVRRDSGEGRT